ncbi:cation-transporting P-type ATPase [Streptomyces niger]|uniref:cation-transporting P-type ATPase n=1 Tax=Streptomyces niger TaxID=66373 RepID=UPI001F3386B4|nr:cation-transporting P-type ATPase [Streptomyces niger]
MPDADADGLRSPALTAVGLSLEKATRRLARYGPNKIPTEPPTPCGGGCCSSCATR